MNIKRIQPQWFGLDLFKWLSNAKKPRISPELLQFELRWRRQADLNHQIEVLQLRDERVKFGFSKGFLNMANRPNLNNGSELESVLWGSTSRSGWNRSTINDYLNDSEASFETKSFASLLYFAMKHADRIEPSSGVRPGFSYRFARPSDGSLVTIWTVRGSGPTLPLRLELSWNYIELGFSEISGPDEIFCDILNQLGGGFLNVAINGKWPILEELSPLDVENFQQAVLEFTKRMA